MTFQKLKYEKNADFCDNHGFIIMKTGNIAKKLDSVDFLGFESDVSKIQI